MYDFKSLVTRNKWTFAKTYAKFAPHEYLVKSKLSREDQKTFEQFAYFLYTQILKGEDASIKYDTKFNRLWVIYILDGYQYWCHAKPEVLDKPDNFNLFSEKKDSSIYVYSQVKDKIFERITIEEYAFTKAVIINRTKYEIHTKNS
jgi:hypothetical protein